ncbi:C40 family peptidase [Paenibacillus cremeus]|uniref:NlpC/P60 family protein n=1 Tax=Paenibacillus cremeus TaxID=2163881 RepID=A0A559JHR0_9BACL|nr:C40 family peptidase [Paenibacillus cremeus]TVX99414.1 NlpC/P60 family protein [Paenibacillus cremeus]
MKIKILYIIFVLQICFGAGCSNQNQLKEQSRQGTEKLVSLSEAAKEHNLKVTFDSGSNSFLVGETDPIYRLKANDTTVISGNSTFTIPEAPESTNGDLLLTTASLNKLFSQPEPEPTSNTMKIKAFSLNAVNPDDIISFAKQFWGTPYQFGAGPYPDSHAFDCSSFMQYIFGHSGISLPRSSREQSTMGTTVDLSSLKPGDLLFFNSEGSSNRMITHVGMFIGNNEFIHTFGAPGVTIAPLNNYWLGRFQWAKRIIS